MNDYLYGYYVCKLFLDRWLASTATPTATAQINTIVIKKTTAFITQSFHSHLTRYLSIVFSLLPVPYVMYQEIPSESSKCFF